MNLRKMKKIIAYFVSLVTVVVITVSCEMADFSDLNNPDDGTHVIVFGKFEERGDTPKIKTDDNRILEVVERGGAITEDDIEEADDRIRFNYSIISQSYSDSRRYKVRLHQFYPLLVKDVVRLSEYDEEEEAEFGKDPIKIVAAWFGGGYVNIEFEFEHNASSNITHYVNLVLDDVSVTSDNKVMLLLKHNLNGDNGKDIAKGIASFDFEDIDEMGQDNLTVGLSWRWYHENDNDRSGETIVFTQVVDKQNPSASDSALSGTNSTQYNKVSMK